MPLYDYRCGEGHIHEDLRAYDFRDKRTRCPRCKRIAKRIPSAHHAETDGIYSYAPNVGSPERYERQRQAIRDGTKVIPRTPGEA